MTKPWYTFPTCVNFGDPNFDVGLGGPHDTDVAAPANYPVTALLAGTVCDLSAPTWGKQVGVKLDTPYNGIPYCAYLHLSAINPALAIGQHIQEGALIGWVGGGNTPADYAGTSNPTGENFLNTPEMSSRIQQGFALMLGPVYGEGAGWAVFPPIDWSLNPQPIIDAARKAYIAITTPSPGMLAQMENTWKAFFLHAGGSAVVPSFGTGIATLWKALYPHYNLGPALTYEYPDVNWNHEPIITQQFSNGRIEWQNGTGRAWNSAGIEITP